MAFQTEYTFTLPNGYVDGDGGLHRQGTMRLATAADEILPLNDPRVQRNPNYLTVLVLSRVITQLGTLPQITPATIESLFARDLAFLNDMYERLNKQEERLIEAVCPQCGCRHAVPLHFTQEI